MGALTRLGVPNEAKHDTMTFEAAPTFLSLALIFLRV
jgi:hypothetical protein